MKTRREKSYLENARAVEDAAHAAARMAAAEAVLVAAGDKGDESDDTAT